MTNNKQSSVDKEFLPYEEAFALFKLGFDEWCFSFYDLEDKLYQSEGYYKSGDNVFPPNEVVAPTFSQAFRFFREKHNLIGGVQYMGGLKPETTWWDIYVIGHFNTSILAMTMKYQPYEEAELACLRKLIEIVKKKQ